MFTRLLAGLGCIALLSACAATGSGSTRAKVEPVGKLMATAEAVLKAGQRDKAVDILQDAAKLHPAEKAPWIRMAQLRFDNEEYGQAIVHAEQALRRDGTDAVANSIAAVSGLRVASRGLAELTRKSGSNIKGNVRSEAEELAKLLRASLGEDVLIPGAGRKRAVVRATKSASAVGDSAPRPTSSDDPFEALK